MGRLRLRRRRHCRRPGGQWREMKYRAISYDVGTFWVREKSTRPIFDEALVRRELAIIKNELFCTTVRIFGQDIDRLMTTAALALEQGLTVWLSPMFVNATAEETLP